MTRDEKLQVIEDMGIRTIVQCPDYSKLRIESCKCASYDNKKNDLTWEMVKNMCGDCWIKALEQPS